MEYLVIYLLVTVGIIIWFIKKQMDDKNYQIKQLKKEWGNVPEEEYTSEKFNSLRAYYKSIKDDQLDVDDITWNDIDMDEIYMLMNNTKSAAGEEYLYALLRKPLYSKEELLVRDKLMKFFRDHEQDRITLQRELSKIGKMRSISVYEYINRLGEQKAKSNLAHYGMALGFLLSIALIFINPALGGGLSVFFLANNIIQYYRRKGEIEAYLTVVSFILRLLEGVKGIAKLNMPIIQPYTTILQEDLRIFKRFQRGSRMLIGKKATGDMMDVIMDYIRMIFHVDLIKYNSMLSFLQTHRSILNRIFENVGYIDSMIAASSFRELMDYYCEPELDDNVPPKIQVKNLYHPLLDNPVPSSINERTSVLITGSNASGKSTFIKTLAINAILSQTIFTSLSESYRASFFMIYSSMALKDNIFGNESYYIVEIKSLKRILDRVNKKIPILCFIDEVLRGTNTLERIAASSRILESLAKNNTIVFAATHDIELTHILESYYSNYHFQEQIKENEIIFDYTLYQGRAVSKNAIKLLGMLGYSNQIISAAEKAADNFLQNGEWDKLYKEPSI